MITAPMIEGKRGKELSRPYFLDFRLAFFDDRTLDFFAVFFVFVTAAFFAALFADFVADFFAGLFFFGSIARIFDVGAGARFFFRAGAAGKSGIGIAAASLTAGTMTCSPVVAAACAGPVLAGGIREIFSALTSIACWAAFDALSTSELAALFTEPAALLRASVSFAVIDFSSSMASPDLMNGR
jgi:hypothetical protein